MTYKPGDILKERYLINEKLGKGAMGEVYRAEHLTLHRQVAIKLMHVHVAENEKSLARFRREAREAAKLDHPHICQVLDFDITDRGDFYIVMEYLKGETLRARLDREGTIPQNSALRIMRDLLSALECAHELGIVHRDIKPDNIMLKNREGRNDFVKLIDFGIAHSDTPDDIHGTLTQAGQIYGTPQYLSPEQVMGDPVDHRADLYSCGCMLYEMLEGVPPFEAENYVLLLNQHLSLAPPHLSISGDNAKELDAVIQKLLQKEPADRFASAVELQRTLESIANPSVPSLNTRLEKVSSKALTPVPLPSSRIELVQSRQQTSTNTQSYQMQAAMRFGLAGLGLIVVAMGCIIGYLINRQSDLEHTIVELSNHQALPAKESVAVAPAAAYGSEEEFSDEEILKRHINRICNLAVSSDMQESPEIVRAARLCLNGDYQQMFDIIHNNREAYESDSLVVRMYLLAGFAVNDNHAMVHALIRLFEIDPSMACNPSVRDIIYSMVVRDDDYEDLRTGLKVVEAPRAAPGLAWLLLFTPCNRYQLRFERLLELYDSLSGGEAPKYLKDAVNVWRPFWPNGSCNERLEYVKKFIDGGLHDICEDSEKIKETNTPATRCSICYSRWQEYLSSMKGQ